MFGLIDNMRLISRFLVGGVQLSKFFPTRSNVPLPLKMTSRKEENTNFAARVIRSKSESILFHFNLILIHNFDSQVAIGNFVERIGCVSYVYNYDVRAKTIVSSVSADINVTSGSLELWIDYLLKNLSRVYGLEDLFNLNLPVFEIGNFSDYNPDQEKIITIKVSNYNMYRDHQSKDCFLGGGIWSPGWSRKTA